MPDDLIPGQPLPESAPAPAPVAAPAPPPPGSGDVAGRTYMEDRLRAAMTSGVSPSPSTPLDPLVAASAAPVAIPVAPDVQPVAPITLTDPFATVATDDLLGDIGADDPEIQLPWSDDGTPTDLGISAPSSIDGSTSTSTTLTPEQDAEAQTAFKSYMLASVPEPDRALHLLLRTSRGKRMYESWKSTRDMEAPATEDGGGGLGFVPSIDQVKTWMDADLAFSRLTEDFDSGDPSNVTAVLNHFFAPSEDGRLRPGAEVAAAHLPGLLASNPATRPLYNQMSRPIVAGFVAHLEQLANQAPNEEWTAFYANAVAAANYVITNGKASNGNGNGNGNVNGNGGANGSSQYANGATNPRQDPEVQRLLASRDREVEDLRRQVGQSQFAHATQFEADIYSEFDSITDMAVDAAIGDLKKVYPERVYDAVHHKFGQDVSRQAQSDPIFKRSIQDLVQKAFRGSPDSRDQAIRRYRQQIGNVVKRGTHAFRASLRNSSNQLREESDQRHALLAAGQGRTEPASSGGAPVAPQGSTAQIERVAGESQVDYLTRKIQASSSRHPIAAA